MVGLFAPSPPSFRTSAAQLRADPELKNIVFVNTHVARGIENDPELAEVFERTLLHEVVHWGRFIGGKSNRINDKEAGSLFEEKAYGIAYIGHHGFSCS